MKKTRSKKLCQFIGVIIIHCCLCAWSMKAMAVEKPLIFPIPQQSEVTNEHFILDETVSIIIPPNTSKRDISLANFLVRDLSDKYGLALKIDTLADVPGDKRVVVMGAISNPLVKKYCKQ